MSKTERRTIGFDRKIQLDWLDATAALVSQQLPVSEIRDRLDSLLGDRLGGTDSHGARGKTKTVLLHIWAQVADEVKALRDEGLEYYGALPVGDRLPLHWGMCLATYPYFQSVSATTGRLLKIQGTAALSQITRRTCEAWGDRSTVRRTVQHVVRSMVAWGVLVDTEEPGVYLAAKKVAVSEAQPIKPWLVEALLRGDGDTNSAAVQSLSEHPALFPFDLTIRASMLAVNSRLEVLRQGLDDDVVYLKDPPPENNGQSGPKQLELEF